MSRGERREPILRPVTGDEADDVQRVEQDLGRALGTADARRDVRHIARLPGELSKHVELDCGRHHRPR
jgi:hypothetical protein